MSAHILKEKPLWSLSPDAVIQYLHSKPTGLSNKEAEHHYVQFGKNFIKQKKASISHLLVQQLTGNPLLIILIIATALSWALGEKISSIYIFGMIALSGTLGFWNEYSAEKVVEKLLAKIAPMALVIRDGVKKEIPSVDVTIGDIILVSQGSILPADIRFIETTYLEVNESILTGESKTIEKYPDALAHPPKDISDLINLGFMGTIVESGEGKGIVIRIGGDTQYGTIAQTASFVKPVTDFQQGLSNFGMMLVRVISLMILIMFALNLLFGHAFLDSLLFSLAIAVGLTPELLPVIVTVSLSHGAGKLANRHVIAKQLIAIENLGNMDVLCTDKTGTLTEGKIQLVNFLDEHRRKNPDLIEKALICNTASVHHKAIGNAIDTAIWDYALSHDINIKKHIKKLDEEPLDFERKYMFTVVQSPHGIVLIAKGAPEAIIPLCHENKHELLAEFEEYSSKGLRTIAIATKTIQRKSNYTWEDTEHLSFAGYLTFEDTPKHSAADALRQLAKLHVVTKVITGDHELIAKKICQSVGIPGDEILLGKDVEELSDTMLQAKANTVNIFARINPHQKLRIIQALKANGHTVGYIGDGINDILALKGADVGISVNTAVDVAKEAASIVLLRKSLDVIVEGIMEGRKTFSNTMKYILMGTSSNFGNMFSAAGASLFLPFLPMTPPQILLNNGFYDMSQVSIPTDDVDPESLLKPRKWNIGFIKKYMLFFGPISSLYDILTFYIMLHILHANAPLFQTGWFMESIATQVMVVFVIRTNRWPFFKSRPGKWIIFTSFAIVGIACLLPYTPLARSLGFVAPPWYYFLILVLLTITYLGLVDGVKNIFLRRYVL